MIFCDGCAFSNAVLCYEWIPKVFFEPKSKRTLLSFHQEQSDIKAKLSNVKEGHKRVYRGLPISKVDNQFFLCFITWYGYTVYKLKCNIFSRFLCFSRENGPIPIKFLIRIKHPYWSDNELYYTLEHKYSPTKPDSSPYGLVLADWQLGSRK